MDQSKRYANLTLKEADLIKTGNHVLCASLKQGFTLATVTRQRYRNGTDRICCLYRSHAHAT